MTDWFDWIHSSLLRAAHALTLNGGEMGHVSANTALDLLKTESEIHIRELVGDTFYNKYFPTNRAGGSWGAERPFGVVDHYTAGVDPARTLRWFSSRERETPGSSSAHFVIDRDGVVMMLIDPRDKIAWHARKDSYTHVGIEHVNAGLLGKSSGDFVYQETLYYPRGRADMLQELGSGFWEPYTSKQVVANVILKRLLVQAIPTLDEEHFVDHQVLDPERKKDCGPLWPLANINALVFSWKPVRNLTSLEPAYMTKNAVALFNSEVPEYLA